MLTGDSFFHLAGYGEGLPGLNMCGAGRVVCLIDPVGDVYACPFAIHDAFLAGNVRDPGGFARVWRSSKLFTQLRTEQSGGACSSCSAYDACQGGCMAAKFFTGLPLDGPDPECVRGLGEQALAPAGGRQVPRPSGDHSHRRAPVPVRIGPRPAAGPRPADPHRRGPTGPATRARWPGSGPVPDGRRVASAGVTSAGVTGAGVTSTGAPAAGRVAVVTGAARGIGAATVRALAADGWSVLAVDLGHDDPAIPYSLGTAAELAAVAAGAGDPAGSRPAPPTSGTPLSLPPRSPRPSIGSAGGRGYRVRGRDRRRRAAMGPPGRAGAGGARH